MSIKVAPLTNDEYEKLEKWLVQNKQSMSTDMRDLFARILKLYLRLSQSADKAQALLDRLREAMGITPKSERSSNALKRLLARINKS